MGYFTSPVDTRSNTSNRINSRNSSTLKQISKFIGIIFSKFVYMENIDRDVILLHQNVVTSSGRTVIRPTRLDL